MGNIDCPCKRTKCERHGNCEACKEHHQGSKLQPLTTCERLKAKKERRNRRKKVEGYDD